MEAIDGETLARAVARAAQWHAGRERKLGGAPDLSHLLQVAGLVLEHGGTTEAAVAAVLHDVVEDTCVTVADVEAAFGPAVAAIVAGCTDTLPGDRPDRKSPWEERKGRYLSRLAQDSAETALVAACDKLHNATSLARAVRRDGLEAVSPPRFSRPPAAQVAFLQAACDAVAGRVPAALEADLRTAVADLAALVTAFGSAS